MLKRKQPDWLSPTARQRPDLLVRARAVSCRCPSPTRQRYRSAFSRYEATASVSFGFRVLLCEGETPNEDGTIYLTETFNEVVNSKTGERDRVDLCRRYETMDALLTDLESQDVRCIRWQDTREYQYIHKK